MNTDRKNINRGYKKLRVWNDAVDLYVQSCKMFKNFPFELKKSLSNFIDASQSISRNIAEGYARKSIKEYIQFLYISLGSCAEYHSCIYSFYKAEQIPEEIFEQLDSLHFKVENELLQLIKSIQQKNASSDWEDNFYNHSSIT